MFDRTPATDVWLRDIIQKAAKENQTESFPAVGYATGKG
jgi:hypothetical protein